MSLNQYSVYQLKQDEGTRPYRYKTYQQLVDNHLTVDVHRYRQVFLTTMLIETSLEEIRRRLETKLPPQFLGNALNVSDVIAITKEGISTAYYVDKVGFVVIPGFFRFHSSAALITMETVGFVLEGRKGSWMTTDETIVDGKQFFLMGSEAYGNKAAYAVVDDQGHKAAEDTVNGFDEATIQQIREYLKQEPLKQKEQAEDTTRTLDGKQKLEIWQKYHENGQYLRSIESGTEENDNMIDGISNNRGGKKRVSVLKRLKQKQREVAARYSYNAPETERNEAERSRKQLKRD